MKTQQLTKLKQFEAQFLSLLHFYVENFSKKVSSNLVFDSTDLSWIEIYLINEKNRKNIKCLFSEGVNVEGKQFYSIELFIGVNSNQNIKEFSIKDFCLKFDLKFNESNFFIEGSNFLEKTLPFLSRCLQIFENEEMYKILFSDYWINVERDFSPYR